MRHACCSQDALTRVLPPLLLLLRPCPVDAHCQPHSQSLASSLHQLPFCSLQQLLTATDRDMVSLQW